MKRLMKLAVLLGVLVVACVATICLSRYEEKKEEIRNSDEILLQIEADSVTALSWDYEETSLSFHRDEGWVYDGDEAFPVDADAMDDLLETFASFGASFAIDSVEDYAQYGLDDPVCTIRFSTEEQDYEVCLGDFSKMDEERYVSIGDGCVYLVREDPLDRFDAELSDLIDHDEVPDFDEVTSIRFSGAQEYEILRQEDSPDTYCPDDVYFAQIDEQNLPLDTSRVEDYLSDIATMGMKDYVTYNATEEELQAYGLDDPELTITVTMAAQTDGEQEDEAGGEQTFVLHVGYDAEDVQKAEEAAAEGDESMKENITAYVRVGESKIVYKITSGARNDLLAAGYDDLRHKEVLTADLDEMWQLDISLEGEVYTLTSQMENDERVWYYGQTKLDMTELSQTLRALSARSFTDEQPEQKEEIGLTVYLEDENHPTVQVELYRCNGEECLAAVNGQVVSRISRSQAVDLIEAVHSIVLAEPEEAEEIEAETAE